MSASSPFAKVPADVHFPAIEEAILRLWQDLDAFPESNRRRQEVGAEAFVFYDGPPFATGKPHYGHLLAGTIKDIVPRFWSMRGYHVERRFGWDCHGLPIEALAQEALGLAGTGAIHETGVDVFNQQCRAMVQTYVAEWRSTVTRMGRWVDFDNDYKTMDASFMESVWWVFKTLWDQGRVYRSHRIMPYSWALTTPLSNFEANANYKEVQDPAITVRFRATGGAAADLGDAVYLLAWTTTPWTLPENLGLCVGPDIEYVAVHDNQSVYVVAEARLGALYKEPPAIVARMKGTGLVGTTYEPLFPYWQDEPGAFRVVADGFVSTDDGTGIVHLAPAYGEDDFRVGREHGLGLVDGLDAEGHFLPIVSEFAGRNCKEADRDIIRWLKQAGKLVRQDTVNHSYPFCERTDTPLIYRAIDAWYVRVEDLREQMVANNQAVHWVPESVGANRFGNWLKEARDWNISRNRFWGSCIPVWINQEDPSDCICVGSVAELEALSGIRVDDLHKHVVDAVVIKRDGKTYRRTPEVLDCWFESGSMPYAQQHFPFAPEHDAATPGAFFPAHFIAEGLDQTRGWFYTLLVLGTALYGQSPYRNVVVNGLILAEDGKKLSKRKKNYPDPNLVLDQYGADALRAYLIDSPVVRGQELRFSEKGLKEIVRTVVLPYWNALAFFTTYAEVDGFDPATWPRVPPAERPDGDRWVLSVLQSLVRDVIHEMEAYRLDNVVPRLVRFIDDLTNWYVRTNRPRFWKTDDRTDQAAAFRTLYEVLVGFAKVLAPFMPFLTEEVHQRLVRPVEASAPASVHWCDYPQPAAALIDDGLEARVAVVRSVVALGRRLREDHKLKVRQPLARVHVICRDRPIRDRAEAGAVTICAELNVKALVVEADETPYADLVVKPDFKVLRQRCPSKLKTIGAALRDWGHDEVDRLEQGQAITVAGEALRLEDVLLQRQAKAGAVVATDGRVTVVLDTTLDNDLRREGHARELISLVQNQRKQTGLAVSDRIVLRLATSEPELRAAIDTHRATIAGEVLATGIEVLDRLEGPSQAVNGLELALAIEVVA